MLGAAKKSIGEIGEKLKKQALFMAGIVVALWVIEIVDRIIPLDLESLGIRPRQLFGVIGIACAPFLHDGFLHLIGNSVALFCLGWVVLLGGMQSFLRVTALIALVSGFGTWLFGAANTVHIGVSGVIYGYMAFLLLRGFFEKSLRWVMVALIVGFTLYGFVDFSIGGNSSGGNGAANISWSGHLSGFIGGILAAWLFYYRPPNSLPPTIEPTSIPAASIRNSILSWFIKRS
ncbi:MAG: membrane associated rhomboid family serine protease [Verrucomicrobiales bacterium]|jgi:membrane associated rhomboid family serine protease